MSAPAPAEAKEVSSQKGKTVLRFSRDIPSGMDPYAVYDEWLTWVWIGGAGVGPKPQVVERGDLLSGQGCLRNIPPINIKERIIEATRPTRAFYLVENPGWRYQVKEHIGEVKFEPVEGGGTKVTWIITVVPIFGFGLLVKSLAYVVIGGCLKNFQSHCKKKIEAEHKASSTAVNQK